MFQTVFLLKLAILRCSSFAIQNYSVYLYIAFYEQSWIYFCTEISNYNRGHIDP